VTSHKPQASPPSSRRQGLFSGLGSGNGRYLALALALIASLFLWHALEDLGQREGAQKDQRRHSTAAAAHLLADHLQAIADGLQAIHTENITVPATALPPSPPPTVGGMGQQQLEQTLRVRFPDLISCSLQDSGPTRPTSIQFQLNPYSAPPQIEVSAPWPDSGSKQVLSMGLRDDRLVHLFHAFRSAGVTLLLHTPEARFYLRPDTQSFQTYTGDTNASGLQTPLTVPGTQWGLSPLPDGPAIHGRWYPVATNFGLFTVICLLLIGGLHRAQRERNRRTLAEQKGYDSEQRLGLALQASNEGLWDWNMVEQRLLITNDCAHLLGLEATEVHTSPRFWRKHIYPTDYPRVRQRFMQHAYLEHQSDGVPTDASLFECEFRLGNGTDRWQWVQCRGRVIGRDADQRPLRTLGIVSNISERHRITDILRLITEGTAATTGTDFYQHLVHCLAGALKMRCAFVSRIPSPGAERSQVVAMWLDDRFVPVFSYALAGTPCAEVIARRTCVYHAHVCQQFQHDEMLAGINAEAYLGVPLFDSHSRPLGLLAVIDDRPLTDTQTATSILNIFAARVGAELERQQAEAALLRQKERAQVTLHSIGDAVITTDESGHVEYLNPVAEKLTGWSRSDAQGMPLAQVFRVVDELTRQPLPDPVRRCIEECATVEQNDRSLLLAHDGREYAIQDSAAPIRADNGKISGVVLVFNDVTETRRIASEMAFHASHDPLTGLVNRREFERRLKSAVISAHSQGLHHALCYIDLDRFKIINDSAGHNAGDELLRQVSTAFKHHIRARDTLARVGGDEFALLLENCPLDTAGGIAQALISAIADLQFVWKDRSYRIGASIGLIPLDADGTDPESLLSRADAACYMAKSQGRGRIHIDHADPGQDTGTGTGTGIKVSRASEIATAIDEERFQLYAQQIIPLQGEANEHQRLEILLRLENSEGAIVEPGGFLPTAERFGFMTRIDRWVIEHIAGKHLALLSDHPDLQIGINLSAASIDDPGLAAFILETFAANKLPLQNICFEINEGTAIGALERSSLFIGAIKAHGARIALDDFSGGLAAFTILRRLPIDYLKLDGGFTTDLGNDPINRSLLGSINEVAHLLDIRTVAERIEDDTRIPQLRDAGVDFAQGNALAPPRPLTNWREF
jgi:diguanylate cyclase (GGDEF)-like protein/PAS domain S-box-containing protein